MLKIHKQEGRCIGIGIGLFHCAKGFSSRMATGDSAASPRRFEKYFNEQLTDQSVCDVLVKLLSFLSSTYTSSLSILK
jgi:hypothetical protein